MLCAARASILVADQLLQPLEAPCEQFADGGGSGYAVERHLGHRGQRRRQQHADRALLRAQALQRPTSLAPSPHQPSALNLSALAWSIEQGTALSEHQCVDSEPSRLIEAGFVGVLLHTDHWPEGDTTLQSIIDLLGEPLVSTEEKLLWQLEPGAAKADPISTSCKTMSENGEALILKR